MRQLTFLEMCELRKWQRVFHSKNGNEMAMNFFQTFGPKSSMEFIQSKQKPMGRFHLSKAR